MPFPSVHFLEVFIYTERVRKLNGVFVDTETSHQLERRLADLGLSLDLTLAELDDSRPRNARLSHYDAGSIPVAVTYSPSMNARSALGSSHRAENERLFVLGDRISPKSAAVFRAEGIYFLDQAGNAYIRSSGLLLDIRGRTPVVSSERNVGGQVNMFSTKRAQVIFALLSWPLLERQPVRRLAEAAEVSVGSAQETLHLLRDAGYLIGDRGHALHKRQELLDRWVAAYRFGVGSSSRARAFAGDVHRFTPAPGEYVSGEAALDSVNHETLTLYVDRWQPRLAQTNRWRTDREPNIFVRPKFWRDPRAQSTPETPTTAPPLLVYADLLAADESRQREGANELRRENPELRAL